jgi:feruloyl esterase
MTARKLAWGIIALTILSASVQAATTATNPTPDTRCQELANVDFSSIQDAPTQIIEAKAIAAAGTMPGYCRIDGYVKPQVGFDLLLPSNQWNGKFMEVGCGGWCGAIDISQCDAALRHGYACIASDMGHKGTEDDTLWADGNLPAQVDFGYRATHVVALSGKAIARRYYDKAPAHSYFVGCSTGGYQGVMEAQRFPWDFDGIVAGAPDIDEAAANLRATWIVRTFLDTSGKALLSHDALQLTHEAVLKRCDMDDGVKDGIIGDPLACKFDPAELLCKSGQTNGCFTPAQVDVINKLYAGPMTSDGKSISTGGYLRGSELTWGDFWPALAVEQFYKFGLWGYSAGPQFKYTDFDFDRDYKRLGLASWYDNSNPDLRKFKDAGGKLIVYHGGTDTVDLPGAVIDYYETVERTMGGRASTQDFFRLFLIPGMNHCTGGAGAYAIDYVSYIERWVEQGKAPDVLMSAHVSDSYLATAPLPKLPQNLPADITPEARAAIAVDYLELPLDPVIPVAFTRPVYPYPTRAKYLGRGDPHSASSFGPVSP